MRGHVPVTVYYRDHAKMVMSPFAKLLWTLAAKPSGMTKYRKGPQRTTKEHYTGPQRIGNTATDPQRTAKEHYGLSCRKLAPTELNGALYSSARQDFSHAAGLS